MKKKLVSLIVAASVASASAPVMAEPKSQDVTVATSSPDNAYLYSAVLRPGARMKNRFINDHRHEFKVANMCRVLELTRGGFYQWILKPLSIAGEGITRYRNGFNQWRTSSPWAATATQTSDEPPVKAAPEPVEAEHIETMTSKPAESVEQSPILAPLADF